jgi:hypothetical protein
MKTRYGPLLGYDKSLLAEDSAWLLTAARIRGMHIRSSFVTHCTATRRACSYENELFDLSCLSFHTHGTVRIPPYSFVFFWLNLIYGTFTKICEIIPIVVKTDNNTDMRRLTTGIRSEKGVVRRFHRCANLYVYKPG